MSRGSDQWGQWPQVGQGPGGTPYLWGRAETATFPWTQRASGRVLTGSRAFWYLWLSGSPQGSRVSGSPGCECEESIVKVQVRVSY